MGKLKAFGRFTQCIRSILSHLTGGTKVYHCDGWHDATHRRVLFAVQASTKREALATANSAGYSCLKVVGVVIPFEQKA